MFARALSFLFWQAQSFFCACLFLFFAFRIDASPWHYAPLAFVMFLAASVWQFQAYSPSHKE